MKTIQLVIIIVSFIAILLAIYSADFKNLISRANLVSLMLILVSIMNITGMIQSFKKEAKNKPYNKS